MSFAAVVPVGGLAGWAFLSRTRHAQQSAMTQSAAFQRDAAHFRDRIGQVRTAEALVADRRLLSVALEAFGLGDDVNNKYFVRKVLESDTLAQGSLVNKLADKRYRDFAKAFGFGDFSTPRTVLSDFPDQILSRLSTQRFERAIGEQNEPMRLALNAERELSALSVRAISDDSKWYTVMGSAPMRKVFQTAFGLPASFARLDLGQQLSTFRARAEQALGAAEIGQFSDPEKISALVRQFLLRSDIAATGTVYSAGSSALTLLRPAASAASLLSRRL